MTTLLDIAIVIALALMVLAGVLIALDKVPERFLPIVQAPLRAWRWIAAAVIVRLIMVRKATPVPDEAIADFEEGSERVRLIERDAEDHQRDADAHLARELERIEARRRARAVEIQRERTPDAELARFDAETEESVR